MATRKNAGIIKDLTDIWAENGDKTPIGTGDSSGWTPDYSQAGGTPVSRTIENYYLNKIYSLGYDVNIFGACLPWDATIPYKKSAVVIGSNDILYKSSHDDNLGNNPIASTAWTQVQKKIISGNSSNITLNNNESINETVINTSQDLNTFAKTNLSNIPVSSLFSFFEAGDGVSITIENNKIKITSNLYKIGDYKISAIASDHGDFLVCDGRAVSRTEYSDLFSLIGVSFGSGNGSTTFNIPNGRSYSPGFIGPNDAIGKKIGAKSLTLSVGNIPSHHHTISHTHGSGQTNLSGQSPAQGAYGLIRRSRSGENNTTGSTDSGGSGSEPDIVSTPAGWKHSHTFSIPTFSGNSGSTGSGQSISMMQPTLYMGNLFIKSK